MLRADNIDIKDLCPTYVLSDEQKKVRNTKRREEYKSLNQEQKDEINRLRRLRYAQRKILRGHGIRDGEFSNTELQDLQELGFRSALENNRNNKLQSPTRGKGFNISSAVKYLKNNILTKDNVKQFEDELKELKKSL